MKKSVLVRDGRHMRPLLSVLKRYGVGTADKYNRGLWLSEGDLGRIAEGMKSDPSAFQFGGRLLVNGTCRHNQVEMTDFTRLFS